MSTANWTSDEEEDQGGMEEVGPGMIYSFARDQFLNLPLVDIRKKPRRHQRHWVYRDTDGQLSHLVVASPKRHRR